MIRTNFELNYLMNQSILLQTFFNVIIFVTRSLKISYQIFLCKKSEEKQYRKLFGTFYSKVSYL